VESLQSRQSVVRVAGLIMACLVPSLLAGCGIGSARKKPHEFRVQQIAREKTELMRDLQQCKAENAQLAEQVQTLSALPQGTRLNPYHLKNITITRYTNFYDKDDDGKREKLIVYVGPIDREGDAFKAAGTVNVQLWNLNNLNGEALLAQWQVEQDDLRQTWYDTLVSASYRLTFDAPEGLDVLAEPLTIKVTFTDYLTGEIFRQQQTLDPKLSQ